ncbi:unnamed protein product, partial [Lymnaea stagnalis]
GKSKFNRTNSTSATLPRSKARHKVKSDGTLEKATKKINWFFLLGKGKS